MSCHDIGRGVDFIMEKVLEMYEDGKISKEAALEMIKVFPKAVHWCDGNEYEAQETLTETYCSACLKKYKFKSDRIINYDIDYKIDCDDLAEGYKRYDWWDDEMKKANFNGQSVCPECFKKYFAKCFSEKGKEKLKQKFQIDIT